jgi:beta-lactamase regulating signal transducer with metallopeptidase domain
MTLGNDWLATAWTQIWQVTVLIVVVSLLARIAAANRPQLAFALWLVVLLKCVAPPLWSSPSGAFCWLQPPCVTNQFQESQVASTNAPRLRLREVSPCFAPSATAVAGRCEEVTCSPAPRHTIVVGTSSEDVLDRGDSSPLSAKRPEIAQNAATPKKGGDESPHSKSERYGFVVPPPANWVAWLWLSGALVAFCLGVWRRIRFAWLLRWANRVEDPLCEEIMASLRRRLRLRRRVRLIATERLVGPAAFGLLRPTVLLPQAVIEGKSAGELELILAHELIHVRRGDLWFGLFRSLVELVWWFHPLVWWAARRASREAERCCDEAVLAELQCGPAGYARCLLDVLEAKHRLRSAPACPGVRAIEITQGRLERIMKIGSRGYRRTPWWCWAVVISAAAVVVPGAAIGTSDDKPVASPRTVDAAAEAKTEPIKPADAQAVRPHGTSVPKKPAATDMPAIAPELEDYERMINGQPAVLRKTENRSRAEASAFRKTVQPSTKTFKVDEPRWSRSEPTLAPPREGSRYSPAQIRRREVFETVREADGVRTYEVQDILVTIDKERGLSRPKDVEFLKNTLKSQVQKITTRSMVAGTNAAIASRMNAGVPAPTSTSIDFNQPPIDILWRRGCFEIETTAEGHRRVSQTLELLRRYGMGQIKMDVRFLCGPAEEIKKANLNWVVLPTELPPSAESNYDGGAQVSSSVDGFLDNRPGPRANRVQYVTEKAPPMIYNILAEGTGTKLLEQWQANKQTNVLQAPAMTVFNAQSVFVSDCTQTPFVIALKDGQPQIRIVHEGTILQFRPLAEADGKLKMDFQVEFSKIGTVETIEISPKREDKPTTVQNVKTSITRAEGTIQIPEVSTTRLEGSVDLPWNQWLLLGGVEALNGGKKPIVVVMMRAEKIEPFFVPDKVETPTMPGPAGVYAPPETVR